MGIVNLVNGIREIRRAVVGGMNGAVLEAANEPDGEAVAAVVGFAVNMFNGTGEMLGLGQMRRLILNYDHAACIVTPLDNAILTVYVDGGTSIPIVERKLDGVLFGKPS